MDEDNKPRTLSTVETACDVIDALRDFQGATITELADELQLSKGGVYNHVATLRKKGLVDQREGEYVLSYGFCNLGHHVKVQSEVYKKGRDEVDWLVEKTEETGNLMVEHNGQGIYLYKQIGREAIPDDYHNSLQEYGDPLHWSATGKAILANLPAPRIEKIIDHHGLPEKTDNTITEKNKLLDELEKTRERGFALNDEEQISGVRAIAAPICKDGSVLGSIGISGPVSRIPENKFRNTYPEYLLERRNIIEVSIVAEDDFEER